MSSVSGDFMQISSDLCEFSSVFFLFWAKFVLPPRSVEGRLRDEIPQAGLGGSPTPPSAQRKKRESGSEAPPDSSKASSIRLPASLSEGGVSETDGRSTQKEDSLSEALFDDR